MVSMMFEYYPKKCRMRCHTSICAMHWRRHSHFFDHGAGAMENWGLITYRETALLLSEDSSLRSLRSVVATIAHEMSHLVRPSEVVFLAWQVAMLSDTDVLSSVGAVQRGMPHSSAVHGASCPAVAYAAACILAAPALVSCIT